MTGTLRIMRIQPIAPGTASPPEPAIRPWRQHAFPNCVYRPAPDPAGRCRREHPGRGSLAGHGLRINARCGDVGSQPKGQEHPQGEQDPPLQIRQAKGVAEGIDHLDHLGLSTRRFDLSEGFGAERMGSDRHPLGELSLG